MNAFELLNALTLQGKVSNDHPTQRKLRHQRNSYEFAQEYYSSPIHKFYEMMEKIYDYFWAYYCLIIENICTGFVVFDNSHFRFNGSPNLDSLKMVGLCIRREKRNLGLGKQMLETICEVSDKSGCSLELAASAFEVDFVDDYQRLVNRIRGHGIGHQNEMFLNRERQAKESARIADWYRGFGFQTCKVPKGVGCPPTWDKKNFLFRFSKKADPKFKENMNPNLISNSV